MNKTGFNMLICLFLLLVFASSKTNDSIEKIKMSASISGTNFIIDIKNQSADTIQYLYKGIRLQSKRKKLISDNVCSLVYKDTVSLYYLEPCNDSIVSTISFSKCKEDNNAVLICHTKKIKTITIPPNDSLSIKGCIQSVSEAKCKKIMYLELMYNLNDVVYLQTIKTK